MQHFRRPKPTRNTGDFDMPAHNMPDWRSQWTVDLETATASHPTGGGRGSSRPAIPAN